jgi:hypothetical protein
MYKFCTKTTLLVFVVWVLYLVAGCYFEFFFFLHLYMCLSNDCCALCFSKNRSTCMALYHAPEPDSEPLGKQSYRERALPPISSPPVTQRIDMFSISAGWVLNEWSLSSTEYIYFTAGYATIVTCFLVQYGVTGDGSLDLKQDIQIQIWVTIVAYLVSHFVIERLWRWSQCLPPML